MATVIGLPLALALYRDVLLLGFVSGVAWLVDLIPGRWKEGTFSGRPSLVLTFGLVLCLLALVQMVPMVSRLVGLGVWFMGIGTRLMVLAERYRASSVPMGSLLAANHRDAFRAADLS